ncbi:MAG: undecaprenyldiphospho-muramoylpentapeptide beta-N-acetylglucosaminyltransferase [Pirellulales bacterium]|nr:undecaprenyldiphospho-muramoylpentapeptide beta-N-acetylglucosaminyltransferase [Pirellulales bacterium]
MIKNQPRKSTFAGVNRPHVVFAGGGTGGHLFPGLAVACQLRRRLPDVRVTFVGSGKPLECQWVGAAGFDYVVLPSRPVPKRFWQFPAFLRNNLAGYQAAKRLLRQRHVSVVVGLGGYASAPVGRAAKSCDAKLVLLEQNVVPGRASRWLARSADAVCLAFAQTAQRLRCRGEIHVTGTPIRPGFHTMTPPLQRRRLLVLGGSNGAESLNEIVPRALYRIREHLDGGEIVHQTGSATVEATQSLYAKLGLTADVVPFIVDMPRMLSWTGLAVSRAGGSTLAELAAAGVPSVLLPYPHAANDHQRKNAELFRDSGGCVLIDQRDVDGRLDQSLAETLKTLLTDRPRRERIAHTMRSLARPDAAVDVAELILDLLGNPRPPVLRPTHRAAPSAVSTKPHLSLSGNQAVRPPRKEYLLVPNDRRR